MVDEISKLNMVVKDLSRKMKSLEKENAGLSGEITEMKERITRLTPLRDEKGRFVKRPKN